VHLAQVHLEQGHLEQGHLAQGKTQAKKGGQGGKKKPLWVKLRPSLGYAGACYLEGEKLALDFEYSEERLKALKAIGGARFDKERKLWTLPINKLLDLQSIELFAPTVIKYFLDELDLTLSTEEREARRNTAREAVSRNPFSVELCHLALCPVDVELLLNPERSIIVVRPRYKSKAARTLSRIKYLIQSRREGGFVVQAHRVPQLLKALRDKEIVFGVESELSQRLKAGAELRAKIIERDDGSLSELSQAMLGPVLAVSEDDDSLLALIHWIPEHLQLLFPNIESFPERKKKAYTLSHDDLPELFDRAISASLKIWVQSELSGFLSSTLPRATEQLEIEREALRAFNLEYSKLRDQVLDTSVIGEGELSSKLFPHQRVGINWLLKTKRAFLGDDMGLGKTLTVLAAQEFLRAEGEINFLFVICPNSLKRNWLRECETWFPKRKLLLMPEKKSERAAFFRHLRYGARLCDGLVINFESVRLADVKAELHTVLKERKSLLCVDESQRIKNPQSKSFASLYELAPYCERRVLLSGTPVPRDISDIWAQVYLLDDGERFGKNFYRWLGQVAELGNAYSEVAVRRYKTEETKEVINRTHELLLRRRKEDVLSLPEKTFTVRDLELTGDQKKFYDEIRKELLLRVTSLTGSTYLREIQSVLEEYLRAVQVCSNPRLIDPTWVGDPVKYLECDYLLEEIVLERGEKVVLWTNYLGNVRELCQRYEKYGARPFSGEVSPEERDRTVKEFQGGDEVKVLVAVPAAGGVGITLTRAQTAIYLDKTWNAEHYLQSIDRIHRIGQTGTVNIISLQASKVDALIAKNLRIKEHRLREVLGDKNRGELIEAITREELLDAVR